MMDKPPRHNDQLGVKKIGKKIKKTSLHLPSPANDHTSKNCLRKSIVPQRTARPPMMGHGDQFWSTTAAVSPVSVSLQSSSGDSGPLGNQMQRSSHQYQSHSPLTSLPSARFSGGGILPTPVSVCTPSPQSLFGDSGPSRNQMKPSHGHDYQQPPRFNGSASILPSPRFVGGPGILPTPPGVQYPSPLKPRSFTSSSMAQGGILGPGKFPRPPHASTGLVFPPSPSGENTN